MGLTQVAKSFAKAVLPLPLHRHLAYLARFKRPAYIPGVRPPLTFNDKIQWRILKDRRTLLAPACDKLWMKEYAARHGVATPRTLWSGSDLAELAEASKSFTCKWVLKPNHLSGFVALHDGPAELSTLQQQAGWWTTARHGVDEGEWAAGQARPLVLAEESLIPDGGDLPDYKFMVFDGRPIAVMVVADRFGNGPKTMSFYGLEPWRKLDVRDRDAPTADPIPEPGELQEMTEAARRLGEEWDFMRIDFYARDGKVWLGELTPYPNSGRTHFVPASFDRDLGAHWELPKL